MSLRGTRFEMSDGLCTFMAGGLGAELYWFCAFPADLIKNKMMADSLRNPEYSSLRGAVRSVWNQAGRDASVARRVRSIYTGFLPCLLRAFPTNAAALFAFEMTMRVMGAESVSAAVQPESASCLYADLVLSPDHQPLNASNEAREEAAQKAFTRALYVIITR